MAIIQINKNIPDYGYNLVLSNCKFCNKLLLNHKNYVPIFCSSACHYNYNTGKRKVKYIICFCKLCNKKIEHIPGKKYVKFCSRECAGKFYGKINGKRLNKICKERNLGFYNSVTQKELGKRVKFETHQKAGRIGGQKTIVILRASKGYKFNSIFWDSNMEREFAISLRYQFKLNFIENVNCHIKIGFFEYDFLVTNCFIEFHPFFALKGRKNFSFMQYYNIRRKNLDKNGFGKYPLIIIQ